MRLPASLRSSFQDAYCAAFGVRLAEAEADEVGAGLAATLGVALRALSRSQDPHLDESANKRDAH